MISYELFADGYCKQLEAFALRGGRGKMISFPSTMALLRHPQEGAILFDTGYTARFFSATAHWPYALYRWLTPVTLFPAATARERLAERGVEPDSLQHLFLSHFHADHMGGLLDFPQARIHCSREGYNSVSGKKGLRAVSQAYLPSLLPDDFEARAAFVDDGSPVALESQWAPFEWGWDLFGDGSLFAIALPGHAVGQMGLAFLDEAGDPVFLIADATWSRQAYRENRPPAWLGWLPQADRKAYRHTLGQLHELHQRSPNIQIIPTHCDEP